MIIIIGVIVSHNPFDNYERNRKPIFIFNKDDGFSDFLFMPNIIIHLYKIISNFY